MCLFIIIDVFIMINLLILFDPQADGALVCFALELGNILIGVQPLLGYTKNERVESHTYLHTVQMHLRAPATA